VRRIDACEVGLSPHGLDMLRSIKSVTAISFAANRARLVLATDNDTLA
jgi:hypothetical protein